MTTEKKSEEEGAHADFLAFLGGGRLISRPNWLLCKQTRYVAFSPTIREQDTRVDLEAGETQGGC